jgi:protein-L-isoaspartate(D-aspartate) O-methyltransferase
MPVGNGGQELVALEDGEPVAEFGTVVFHPMLVEGEQATSIERNRTHREDREHARRAAERRKGWEQQWIDWDDRL